jgi:selenocysteine lyase/cysteine desulfurase
MAELGVDYLAMSGHKLYAPYGVGVLVGRDDWLREGDPYLAGGGAVEFVTTDEVLWAGLPERQEAGSPNVVGAIALAAACSTLRRAGMDCIASSERSLVATAEQGLRSISGVTLYSLWGDEQDRIGVLTFNVAGFHHGHVAAALSAEHGIGVRHGCFCAHPLMLRILNVTEDQAISVREAIRKGCRRSIPGAIRASFGLGTTNADVVQFVEAVRSIAARGPEWSYQARSAGDEYRPTPDPRPRRSLHHFLS